MNLRRPTAIVARSQLRAASSFWSTDMYVVQVLQFGQKQSKRRSLSLLRMIRIRYVYQALIMYVHWTFIMN